MTRRSSSASTTPIDSLGKELAGRTPRRRARRVRRRSARSPRGARPVQRQHVHALGRDGLAQRRSTSRRSSVRQFQIVRGLADLPGVVLHRGGVAVLQALLPAGGEEAQRLARGDDDVHLGGRELLDHRRRLLGGRRGEELVADEAVTVPRASSSHSRAQAVRCRSGCLARFGSSRTTREAQRWSRRSWPGSSNPSSCGRRGRPTGSSGGRSWRSSAGRCGEDATHQSDAVLELLDGLVDAGLVGEGAASSSWTRSAISARRTLCRRSSGTSASSASTRRARSSSRPASRR